MAANMMFCTGHVVGLCQEVRVGSTKSGRPGLGIATGIETVINFLVPGHYLHGNHLFFSPTGN